MAVRQPHDRVPPRSCARPKLAQRCPLLNRIDHAVRPAPRRLTNRCRLPLSPAAVDETDPAPGPFRRWPHIPATLAFGLGPVLSSPTLSYFSASSCEPSATVTARGPPLRPRRPTRAAPPARAPRGWTTRWTHCTSALRGRTNPPRGAARTGATARSLRGGGGMNGPSGLLPDTRKRGDSVDSVGRR